ncbi:MAG: DUF5715 family protein [Bacteroidales bacterium]|nr:DUF5715 family protein [Bacteroidales bacterium]
MLHAEGRAAKGIPDPACGHRPQLRSHVQRQSSNAVTNSCHRYGTTFDISYARMTDEQKQTLARVLQSLRRGGYCYVKYEINQPCFHITARQ